MTATLSTDTTTPVRLPIWTWWVPLLVCHLGTQLSIISQFSPGYGFFYFPVTLGIIMIHWWGPRVLLGVFVNAAISAGLWNLPNPWLYPLYAFPETLDVFLSWLLFTHWQKGKVWIPNLHELLQFLLWSIFIPSTLSNLTMGISLNRMEILPTESLLTSFIRGSLPEYALTATVGILVLAFGTRWMESKKLSLTRGAKTAPFPPIPSPLKTTFIRELILISSIALVMSFYFPFISYWFLFGIINLYTALRQGFRGALLITNLVFLFTYILPILFPTLYPLNPSAHLQLVVIQLGMALLTVFSLIVGRSQDDFRLQQLQMKAKNKELERYNQGYHEELARRKTYEGQQSHLIKELASRNQEMEQFTYSVTHDLKSPLITVSGYVQLLRQDISDQNWEEVEQDLLRIEGATLHMDQLLTQLLQLSRVGRMHHPREAVRLTPLINESLSLLSSQTETAPKVRIMPDLPVVWVDKTRIHMVFQNLLENALKFMGGQVQPQITIGHRPAKAEGYVCLYVQDNGMGIPPNLQEQIFGLFKRLEPSIEGTGIGLALVKRIIEVYGGEIWVESAGEGQGSTFCFTLPLPVMPKSQSDN